MAAAIPEADETEINASIVFDQAYVKKAVKSRSKRFFILIVLLVVTAITIGVSVGVTEQQKRKGELTTFSPTMSPTFSPTLSFVSKTADLESIVQTTMPPESTALSAPNTPQRRAFDWILEEARAGILVDNEDRIRQRFILIVLYYATSGPTAWTTQHQFLQQGVDECFWADVGIKCNTDGMLTELDIGTYGDYRFGEWSVHSWSFLVFPG